MTSANINGLATDGDQYGQGSGFIFHQESSHLLEIFLQLAEENFVWLKETLIEAKHTFASASPKLLPKTPSAQAKRARTRITVKKPVYTESDSDEDKAAAAQPQKRKYNGGRRTKNNTSLMQTSSLNESYFDAMDTATTNAKERPSRVTRSQRSTRASQNPEVSQGYASAREENVQGEQQTSGYESGEEKQTSKRAASKVTRDSNTARPSSTTARRSIKNGQVDELMRDSNDVSPQGQEVVSEKMDFVADVEVNKNWDTSQRVATHFDNVVACESPTPTVTRESPYRVHTPKTTPSKPPRKFSAYEKMDVKARVQAIEEIVASDSSPIPSPRKCKGTDKHSLYTSYVKLTQLTSTATCVDIADEMSTVAPARKSISAVLVPRASLSKRRSSSFYRRTHRKSIRNSMTKARQLASSSSKAQCDHREDDENVIEESPLKKSTRSKMRQPKPSVTPPATNESYEEIEESPPKRVTRTKTRQAPQEVEPADADEDDVMDDTPPRQPPPPVPEDLSTQEDANMSADDPESQHSPKPSTPVPAPRSQHKATEAAEHSDEEEEFQSPPQRITRSKMPRVKPQDDNEEEKRKSVKRKSTEDDYPDVLHKKLCVSLQCHDTPQQSEEEGYSYACTPSPKCPKNKIVRPMHVKSFLGSVQKSKASLAYTPSSGSGHRSATVITSFIKRNTPKKMTIDEMREKKKQQLAEKEQREQEALKKREQMMKEKIEEQKRKREERTAKVRQNRRQVTNQEERQKQLISSASKPQSTVKRTQNVELEKRKQQRLKKQQEAEERRKREEQDRFQKLKEQQEDQKRTHEHMQRKKEYEERERREKLAEQKRLMEERIRQEREKEENERKRQQEALDEKSREWKRQLEEGERERERERIMREKAELDRLRERENLAKAQLEKDRDIEKKRLRDEVERKASTSKQQNTSMLNASLNTSANKANTSYTIYKVAAGNPDTYEMTPQQKTRKSPIAITGDNYDITDKLSDDSTDEEENPKKKIPQWALGAALKVALINQIYDPPNIDKIFPPVEMPDLTRIFKVKKSRFTKRTSSAYWDEPPANQVCSPYCNRSQLACGS